MSLNKEQSNLLREYVRLISEEGDGGGGDGGYGGYGGGGGMGYGHGASEDFFKDIWNAIVHDPLSSVGRAMELFSSKLQKIAGYLAEDIMSMALPGYIRDYERYDEEESDRLEAIREKYKEVLGRTEANLFTGDAALMGFLAAPHEFIAGRFLRDSPDMALTMVDIISGGTTKDLTDKAREYSKVVKHYGRMHGGPTSHSPKEIEALGYQPKKNKLTRWWREPKTNFATSKSSGPGSSRYQFKDSYDRLNSNNRVLSEGEMLQEIEALKKAFGAIKSLFKGPEIKQRIEQSPMAKEMQKDAENYIKSWVQGFVELTNDSLDLENTQKLNQMTNGKFEKVAKQAGNSEDVKKVAKLAVQGTRKAIKDQAKKVIGEKIKQLPGGKNHELASIYLQGLKAIT